MNHERMQQIETEVADRVRRIRETKGREYANEEDTLADFHEVAAEAGITPLQCWLTYVQKHQRAISTFVREGSTKSESIQDRIIDVIVYHQLLLGLIEDMQEAERVANPPVTAGSVRVNPPGAPLNTFAAYDGDGNLLA